MTRKYTKRQATIGSNQGDAFAAILRPVVNDLVREAITSLAQSWLTRNAPNVPPEIEAVVISGGQIPEPVAAKKSQNGRKESNGAASKSELAAE